MKGRKRHLLVDADGLILKRRVLPVDSADRDTAIGLLKEYDALPATGEGWIDLTMIRLLATRLAR